MFCTQLLNVFGRHDPNSDCIQTIGTKPVTYGTLIVYVHDNRNYHREVDKTDYFFLMDGYAHNIYDL